ncbi:L,D-transpeptidase [Leifsonia sp. C5G2]|uniref:L,D-transpeptidase n=1 Tax=Leifsonia sp. C5G2 TaxID=2735269 RepID=UPI001585AC50|nr:L,D-transpeptidase [Leifsonia sp. C5G2]NUU06285.1 L,D-transpeptidase [Leifsonia sp. C5G2]
MTRSATARWRTATSSATVLLTLGLALALSGCVPSPGASTASGAEGTVASSGAEGTRGHGAMLAATAKAGLTEVPVAESPGGAQVASFASPNAVGAPLTFYVLAKKGDWLQVELPQRPNGSTGWVRAADVVTTGLRYRVQVSTAKKRLWVYSGDRVVESHPVATGTGGTPTPHGDFYITELLRPTNTGYGPYAFGLSAFSTVLDSFAGGPGQIGIHGTADSASIGRAASHGCIRLGNDAITRLAGLLPLGTPVSID